MPPLQQLNAFLEDTCVLVTLAYLLSRGSLLPKLFDRRRSRGEQAALALIFGLLGASDVLFPGGRLPYAPSTLAASFAGYTGGLGLGLLTAGVTTTLFVVAGLVGGPHLPFPPGAFAALAAVIGAAGARGGRRATGERRSGVIPLLFGAFAVSAVGEALHAGGRHHGSLMSALVGIGANGFGCLLLTSILWDTYERRRAAQRLLQSERENAALRLTQLGELQARLHPHFLFNTLAAIAGLCVVRPSEAERSVTELASLLRRFLHAPSEKNIPLREEMTTVRLYLSIEKLRMGDRLSATEEVRRSCCPAWCHASVCRSLWRTRYGTGSLLHPIQATSISSRAATQRGTYFCRSRTTAWAAREAISHPPLPSPRVTRRCTA